MTDTINLAAKLATFSDYFQPRTVAQMNNHDVNCECSGLGSRSGSFTRGIHAASASY